MSSYGVGQGLQQGINSLIPIAANVMRMKQQKEMFDKQLLAQTEWARGLAQLGPSYEDGQPDSDGAPSTATMPSTDQMGQPSQVGRLEVPGQALAMPKQPTAPQAAPARPAAIPMAGASALAFPSIGRRPRLRFNN